MNSARPFFFYLFYYGAAAALLPFAALYYQSLGFSGAQIGLLTGLSPLVTLLGAPFWTGLADAFHLHKAVLSLTLAGVIVCALAIPSGREFAVLLPMVLLISFFGAPIPSLGDSATMATLGERRALYGRVRIGGTIGWGIMGYLAGLIMEGNGIRWAFWIYAAGMALTLLISQGLVFGRVEASRSFWHGVRQLLADRRWILFLLITFIAGAGSAAFHIYQFVYMAEIGSSKSLMGLSLTIATLSEMPVMFFANKLIKRLGVRGLLALGLAFVGLRGLLYFALSFPLAILFIQLIHGLTFPAIWIAGVSFAAENAPAELQATGQGLFAAMMSGFGPAVAGLLGGVLLGAFSGRVMYLIFGSSVLVCLLFFLLAQNRLYGRHAQVV